MPKLGKLSDIQVSDLGPAATDADLEAFVLVAGCLIDGITSGAVVTMTESREIEDESGTRTVVENRTRLAEVDVDLIPQALFECLIRPSISTPAAVVDQLASALGETFRGPIVEAVAWVVSDGYLGDLYQRFGRPLRQTEFWITRRVREGAAR